jgi:molybdopterin/thiamine biosynthesis adenylyltransferase
MNEPALDAAQLERYARHVVLDEVGAGGQQALCESRVLVVGAGGLGSPAVQYLAAAGIGTLGIADGDRVERSNLQRQVIHGTADIGRSKVDSAAEFVGGLNPDVTVRRHGPVRAEDDAPPDDEALGEAAPVTASDLVTDYDVVIDATDRIDARDALNAACVASDTPLVFGAVERTEGQVATLIADGAPCYRCLFPDATDGGPDCATAGVLGVLPGVIGTMQAAEAINLLLDAGDPLVGRLAVYDAFGATMETVPVAPATDCPTCGAAAGNDGEPDTLAGSDGPATSR